MEEALKNVTVKEEVQGYTCTKTKVQVKSTCIAVGKRQAVGTLADKNDEIGMGLFLKQVLESF